MYGKADRSRIEGTAWWRSLDKAYTFRDLSAFLFEGTMQAHANSEEFQELVSDMNDLEVFIEGLEEACTGSNYNDDTSKALKRFCAARCGKLIDQALQFDTATALFFVQAINGFLKRVSDCFEMRCEPVATATPWKQLGNKISESA